MAFFCFMRKFPKAKTNYNCREAEERHARQKSRTSAVDEDLGPYGVSEAKVYHDKALDKYGIDMTLDGSLKRSKKKKKVKKSKSDVAKLTRIENKTRDERENLISIMNNATRQQPVRIKARLVQDYVINHEFGHKILKGEDVISRYRHEDCVFVQCDDGREGFVPTRYCYLISMIEENEALQSSPLLDCPPDRASYKDDTEASKNEAREAETKSSLSQPDMESAVNTNDETNLEMNQDLDRRDGKSKEECESDSLARRIRKHEIRQLLKRETSQQIMQRNAAATNKTQTDDSSMNGNSSVLQNHIKFGSISSISHQTNYKQTDDDAVSKTSIGSRIEGNSCINNDTNFKHPSSRQLGEKLSTTSCDYFYNGHENTLPIRNGGMRIPSSIPSNGFLENRRCTSLRKGSSNGIKVPLRAYSLRSAACSMRITNKANERYENKENIHIENNLLRTPGSINSLLAEDQGEYSIKRSLNDLGLADVIHSEVYALKDFLSSSKDDLSIAKGERLKVIRKDSQDWWWVQNYRGQGGFVPRAFLTTSLTQKENCQPFLIRSRSDVIHSNHQLKHLSSCHNHHYNTQIIQNGDDNCMMKNSNRSGGNVSCLSDGIATQINECNCLRSHSNSISCQDNGSIAVVAPSPRKEQDEAEENLIESKEALLKKIRSEIYQDPVANYQKKNTRTNSQSEKFSSYCYSKTDSQSSLLFMNELLHKPLEGKFVIQDGFHDKRDYLNMNQIGRRLKLPSYDEYIEDRVRANDEDTLGQFSSSYSDCSNLDGSIFGTPRILRRRKTYSGVTNKKVRFSQTSYDSSLQPVENLHQCEARIEDNCISEIPELSTWC